MKEKKNLQVWDKTVHDFGKVKPKTKITAEFNYLGDKKIINVKSSCGCTATKQKENAITGIYTTSEFPMYLKDNNITELSQQKYITVTFDDHTTQQLIIKGKSIK